jgi:hypothetical protein
MAATATKATKLTSAQYKELLGDTKKEIKLDLKKSELTGKLDTIVKRLQKKVDESEITSDWKIISASGSSYYSYSYRRYEKTPDFYIVGYRPYTDDEIEKQGATLLRRKLAAEERAEKQRAANVRKFNKLAETLGVETITED